MTIIYTKAITLYYEKSRKKSTMFITPFSAQHSQRRLHFFRKNAPLWLGQESQRKTFAWTITALKWESQEIGRLVEYIPKNWLKWAVEGPIIHIQQPHGKSSQDIPAEAIERFPKDIVIRWNCFIFTIIPKLLYLKTIIKSHRRLVHWPFMVKPQEKIHKRNKSISNKHSQDNRLIKKVIKQQNKPLPFFDQRLWAIALLLKS